MKPGEKNAMEYWQREAWNVRNLLGMVYPYIDNPMAKTVVKQYLDFHEIEPTTKTITVTEKDIDRTTSSFLAGLMRSNVEMVSLLRQSISVLQKSNTSESFMLARQIERLLRDAESDEC